MRFKEKIINLSRIHADDHTFRITTRENVDDLMDSIQNVGILNLPLLMEKGPEYIILCGFRRIEACRRLGWSGIRSRILDSDTKKLKCTRYAITDNASQRPLNLIETSRSIQMLSPFFSDINELSQEMSILGLPDHPSVIKKIKDICLLPKSIQNGILSDTISLAMALELGKMPKNVGEDFVKLFNFLKPSLNKQREIIIQVKEISLREGIPMERVLENHHLTSILTHEDLDKNQKTEKIRNYLKQRRFPTISRTEKIFEKHLKKLNLGKGVKLIPPHNFEGTTYMLKFSFNSLNELKELKTSLDTLVQNPSLKKIISLSHTV